MQQIICFLFILGCTLFSPAMAQVIGDEALQKLQAGQVSFLDGEFIVFLDDTVSPGFVESSIKEAGFEISYSDINPILVSIVNSPADSVISKLERHPQVRRSYFEAAPVDTSYFQELLAESGLTGLEYDLAYARLLNSQAREEHLFEFEYSVNEPALKEIMGNFRSIAYQILQNYPRSVNVRCEPGTEQEKMEQIEKLPFVESTALIGVLGE